MKSETSIPEPVKIRDLRLDAFRGIALIMIFINHVPGTVYEHFTSRNFGFSDAAEGFVFMSGIAAGLAYSNGFKAKPLWPAISKVWGRSRHLYLMHITSTVIALAIFAFAAKYYDQQQLFTLNNIAPMVADPLGALIGVPLLTHQIGYFNILPLYTVLLFVCPVFIILALHSRWLAFGVAAVIWWLAAQFYIDLPNYPTSGGWYFNPFSWSILFVAGLVTGIALKNGERFIPASTFGLWLTGLFLVFVFAWLWVPGFLQYPQSVLNFMRVELGLPFYIWEFDKTYQSLPRLLHFFALAYFLCTLPHIKTFANSKWARPFILLGQHGLAVFVFGSILCVAAQAIKAILGDSFPLDTALISGGIALQFLLAFALRKNRQSLASAYRIN